MVVLWCYIGGLGDEFACVWVLYGVFVGWVFVSSVGLRNSLCWFVVLLVICCVRVGCFVIVALFCYVCCECCVFCGVWYNGCIVYFCVCVCFWIGCLLVTWLCCLIC